MKPRTLFPALLLLAALLFTGCGHTPPPQTGGSEPSASAAVPDDAPPKDDPDAALDAAVLAGENERCGKTEDDGVLQYRLVNNSFYEVCGTKAGATQSAVVTVPSTFQGKPVKRIKGKIGSGAPGGTGQSGAFQLNTSLRMVTVSGGIVEIGPGAFLGCLQLQKVILPASLRRIGEDAFDGCFALREFQVAKRCESFCSIDGVLFSGDGKRLLLYPMAKPDESYTLPQSVTEIVSLGGNSALTSLVLPEGLEKIGELGALQLPSLTLPESLTKIRYFGSFWQLTALHIPKNLTTLGILHEKSDADRKNGVPPTHDDLPLLAEITVDKENPAYSARDGVLFDKTGQTLLFYPTGRRDRAYTVPDGVREICDISENLSLSTLHLPEGLEKIGRLCSLPLTDLRLPESVKEIAMLGGLNRLRELHIPKNLTSLRLNHYLLPAGTEQRDFHRCSGLTSLEKITVDEGNSAYSATDGILFDKAAKTLLCYPPAKPDERYVLPEGAKTVAQNGLFSLHLQTLLLPASLRELPTGAIVCESLTAIYIPAGEQMLSQYCIRLS